jgi:hypothetical protein
MLVPTDPVAGRAAFWLRDPQGIVQYTAARLAFQWDEDAWAFVSVASTVEAPGTPASLDDLRARARAVAATVEIRPAAAVTTPYTLSGTPDGYRLTGTSLYRGERGDGDPFTRTTLIFGDVDERSHLLHRGPDGNVSVTADSGARTSDKPGSTNTTIDGHPAMVSGGTIILYNVDTFGVEIQARDEAEARRLAAAVRIVSNAQDESRWTDRPLR